MGYYTTLKFKCKLKPDTPKEVINFLKRVIVERNLGHEEVLSIELTHPFFKCERSYMLFISTDGDDSLRGGRFYQENNLWILDLETKFKDYDDEIELFVDWITPFIIGRKKKKYLGYCRGESANRQTNIYREL